jgi:hypothetical protein
MLSSTSYTTWNPNAPDLHATYNVQWDWNAQDYQVERDAQASEHQPVDLHGWTIEWEHGGQQAQDYQDGRDPRSVLTDHGMRGQKSRAEATKATRMSKIPDSMLPMIDLTQKTIDDFVGQMLKPNESFIPTGRTRVALPTHPIISEESCPCPDNERETKIRRVARKLFGLSR